MEMYKRGLEKLLGREIQSAEIGLNIHNLREEAREAIAMLEATGSICRLSEELTAERTAKGTDAVVQYLAACGKTPFVITTEQRSNH